MMRSNLQTVRRVQAQPLAVNRRMPPTYPGLQVSPLGESEAAEVYRFLSRNPLRTFSLMGMMLRNGLTGPQNRGTFYGCRDQLGTLRGVALIGHFTLFEAPQAKALKAFAALARLHPDIHLLLGEQEDIRRFCAYYGSNRGAPPQSSYTLFVADSFPEVKLPAPLRRATMDDLDAVVAAHAQGTLAEKGKNPLQIEPDAFRRRCAQRIEQQVTWIAGTEGELVFKAEMICASPDVAYLEGIWVPPTLRRSGYGQLYLAALGALLLEKSRYVCLLANEAQPARLAFYKKAGFTSAGHFLANCV